MCVFNNIYIFTVFNASIKNGSGILCSSKYMKTPTQPALPNNRPLNSTRAYSSILASIPSLVQTATTSRLPLAFNSSPSYKTLLAATTPGIPSTATTSIRPLTKFSRQSGKRKSVKAVLKRFMRLDWGAWIRTKSGRHKKLWKKTSPQKRRLRQHVFTNSTQSWLLDSMVTNFWRRPKHYVNDPYRPYHTRDEFPATRRNR